MKTITRAEAKAAGLTRYFTGKPCPQGHVAEKLVSNKCCVNCNRARIAPGGSRRHKHIERIKRQKAPGGSQRHNWVKSHKKWQKSDSPAAMDNRFINNIRRRIQVIFFGRSKRESTAVLLGCPVSGAKLHIASQFHSGMSWSNNGSVWELDHIRPLSSFNNLREDRSQYLQAFHYMNLQPLLIADHRAKSIQENKERAVQRRIIHENTYRPSTR